MGSEECEGDGSPQVGHVATVLLEGVRESSVRRAPRHEGNPAYAVRAFPPRLVLFFCPRRHRGRRPLPSQKGRGVASVHSRECRQIRIVDAMEAKAGTFRIRPCGQERWEARNAKGTAHHRSATSPLCCWKE